MRLLQDWMRKSIRGIYKGTQNIRKNKMYIAVQKGMFLTLDNQIHR